jgi:hypothetical protein
MKKILCGIFKKIKLVYTIFSLPVLCDSIKVCKNLYTISVFFSFICVINLCSSAKTCGTRNKLPVCNNAITRNEGRNKDDSLYDNRSWAKHSILAWVTYVYIYRLCQFFEYSFLFILMCQIIETHVTHTN